MLRWDSTTPLGRPVLPLVYRMASMSVSMTRWPVRAARPAGRPSQHATPAAASGAQPFGEHHVAHRPGSGQHRRQQRQPLGRGDQHAHVAVLAM
jgi:hypothetical protein